MKTTDFDYELPQELIAQTPMEPRDHSRLMVLHRDTGAIEHKHFYDIVDYLNPGDALVINETKVIPARLLGVKEDTGVPVEVLLLAPHQRHGLGSAGASGPSAEARVRRAASATGCCAARCMENVAETGGRMVRFSLRGRIRGAAGQAWARCRCLPTSTRSWPTRTAIRRSTPSRRAPPPRPQRVCISPPSCWKRCGKRA